MTLPALINNARHKELEAGLKKNYSVIQQAFDMFFAENGYRLKADSVSKHELKPLIIKYFSVLRDCGFGAGDAESACIPAYEISNDNYKGAYKTFNGGTMRLSLIDDGQFVLTDGSLILLENVEGPVYISVDVNGYNKNPNRWGHDLFTFQLTNDGKILPVGAEGTNYKSMDTYCSQSSSHIYNGVACTYKALSDKDYFKNLPK